MSFRQAGGFVSARSLYSARDRRSRHSGDGGREQPIVVDPVQQPVATSQNWTCSTCTFINTKPGPRCTLCRAENPGFRPRARSASMPKRRRLQPASGPSSASSKKARRGPKQRNSLLSFGFVKRSKGKTAAGAEQAKQAAKASSLSGEQHVRTRVVGCQFHAGAAALEEVSSGTPAGSRFALVREPGNRFDANAVLVYLGDASTGTAIGHLPRAVARSLSAFLDTRPAGFRVRARVPIRELQGDFKRVAMPLDLWYTLPSPLPRALEEAAGQLREEGEASARRQRKAADALAKKQRRARSQQRTISSQLATKGPAASRASSNALARFPKEILQNIFLQGLTVHDFVSCRAVCRTWAQAVDDEHYLTDYLIFERMQRSGSGGGAMPAAQVFYTPVPGAPHRSPFIPSNLRELFSWIDSKWQGRGTFIKEDVRQMVLRHVPGVERECKVLMELTGSAVSYLTACLLLLCPADAIHACVRAALETHGPLAHGFGSTASSVDFMYSLMKVLWYHHPVSRGTPDTTAEVAQSPSASPWTKARTVDTGTTLRSWFCFVAKRESLHSAVALALHRRSELVVDRNKGRRQLTPEQQAIVNVRMTRYALAKHPAGTKSCLCSEGQARTSPVTYTPTYPPGLTHLSTAARTSYR